MEKTSTDILKEEPKQSRFRGVYKIGNRWKTQIRIDGRQHYIGSFVTEEEAARAYDLAAVNLKANQNPKFLFNYSKLILF